MIELFKIHCHDRSGEHDYSIRVLHEFTVRDDYLDSKKISELWSIVRQHDVLFSDYTAKKVEPFLAVLFNPSSVWLEIYRETSDPPGPVGVAYITHVKPGFDANGHFAFFDKIASGREEIVWTIMKWMFERFGLRRISAEIPKYQSGVIRFTKKLGFRFEGERRDGVIHKGKWMPLLLFGILQSELYSLMKGEENE